MLNQTARTIEDPPIAKFLFGNTAMAWLWLVVRIYLGWKWLDAGLHKMTPAWLDGWGRSTQGFLDWRNRPPNRGSPADCV